MQEVDINFDIEETFRPWVISRKPGLLNSILYWIRLGIDTPYRSLITGVKPLLKDFSGNVLDIGAGSQFFKRYLPKTANYRALELKQQGRLFGWEEEARNIDFYDGIDMPYENESFNNILCLEVFEHCKDPSQLIREIERVIKPSGTVVISVPFAAKWHYIPHDYWRFTPSGLKNIFSKAKTLKLHQMLSRGTDFTVIFHTTASALTGFLFRKSILSKIAGVLLFPLAYLAGLLANISDFFDLGAPENNIGYICILKKI